MAEGAEFPPVVLFFDGAYYWLADGFHRFFAAKKCGAHDVVADVRQGARRDARLRSLAGELAETGAADVRALTLDVRDSRAVFDAIDALPETWKELEVLVNNTKWDGLRADGSVRPDFTAVSEDGETSYYSELPKEGTTELWEIVNLTADAHPIHLHLVQFQLMNRQPFDVAGYNAAYDALFPATNNTLDPMTGLTYPGGVFIGGYGPPAHYTNGTTFQTTPVKVTNFLGGNPDMNQRPPVGTGFYQFVSRKQGIEFNIKRVPYQHWRAMPDFPEIQFRWINEVSTCLAKA